MTKHHSPAPAPKRVVTGHNDAGKSIFISTNPAPTEKFIQEAGVNLIELWATDTAPAPILAIEKNEPTQRSLQIPPEPLGTKARIIEYLPGHVDEQGLQSPMHRTETVDLGIILEGEVVLILEGVEETLRAGDTFIQRGTNHAWANRSEHTCRMICFIVDGSFQPELLKTLPEEIQATVLRGGPTHS